MSDSDTMSDVASGGEASVADIDLDEALDPRKLPAALRKHLLDIFDDDLPRSARVRRFALLADRVDEMATWFATDRSRVERVLLRMEMTYGLATKVRALRRAITQRASEMAMGDGFGAVRGITVGRSLEDATAPSVRSLGRQGPGAHLLDGARARALLVPFGYELCPDGVYALAPFRGGVDIKRVRVCPRPLFLAGQAVDMATGFTRMVLVWSENAGDRWVAHETRRDTIMDARQVVALSANGAPVTSANRNQITRYLSEFERANLHLPARIVSSRLGWIIDQSRANEDVQDAQTLPKSTVRGFLLPAQYLPVPRRPRPPTGAPPLKKKDRYREVVFDPPQGIERELVGLRRAGTWKGWCEAAEIARSYPLVMLALYAACAAPLIEVLGAQNFIVDFSDATSSGKTSALRFAASAMGSPDDRGSGVMFSWDESSAWIESMAGALYSLPLLLDDTKRADLLSIHKIIFAFTQGRGHGRANTVGIRTTATWRSTMLSSGEAPLYEFVRMAGARARMLCIQGRPLGPAGDTNRAAAEEIGAIIDDNHGWLMPRVIEFLLAREAAGEWTQLREAYIAAKRDFIQVGLARDGVSSRQAQYVAILKVAQSIVHAVGTPEPKPELDPVARAMEAAFEMAISADIPAVAFGELLSWCVANQQTFWGRHRIAANGRPTDLPRTGWSGVWAKAVGWSEIAIREAVVRQVLLLGGYIPQDVTRRWIERKFVTGDQGARYAGTRAVKIDGVPVRCYCIPRMAFDETIGVDAVDIDDGKET